MKHQHNRQNLKPFKKSSQTRLPGALLKAAIQKSYKADAVIHDQGEEVKFIAMILSGQALAMSYDIQGKESWVNSYIKNQLIGVESLFDNYTSSCRVIAKTDVSVLYFPKTLFLHLIRENTALSNYVMRDLIGQVRHYSAATVEVQSLSKRGLIASEFKRLAQPCETAETYVIAPAPVLTELALKLGVARETVSRTVSDLVKKNVLQRQSGTFIVPDISRLEAQMV